MKPLERSPTAQGLITLTVNNFFKANDKKQLEVGYHRYLALDQVELLDYDNASEAPVTGGIGLLFLEKYQSAFRKVLEECTRCLPGTLEELHRYGLNRVRQRGMEQVWAKIMGNRWDICLLLNGTGMSYGLELLVEAFIAEQEGETNVTTVATNQAGSGLGMLLGTGNRRIASPSTRLMLHFPMMTSTNLPINLSSYPMMQEHCVGRIQSVVDKTLPHWKNELSDSFCMQSQAPNNTDGKIRWIANESPGFIQEYLDPNTSFIPEIEKVIARPVRPENFAQDIVSRFALESETERQLWQKNNDVSVCAEGNSFHTLGPLGFDTAQAIETIIEIINESGKHTARRE